MSHFSAKIDSDVANTPSKACATGVPGVSGSGVSKRSRRVAAIAVLAACLLVIAFAMTGVTVRNSIRELTRQSLRSALSANVTSLTMWFTEMRSEVARLSATEEIDMAVRKLLERRSTRTTWSLADVQDDPSHQSMLRDLDMKSHLGWVLTDAERRVVASSCRDLVGLPFEIPSDAWSRLSQRSTTVSRPFRSPVALTDQGSLSQVDAPVMCAMAPIMDGARLIGSLVLLVDPSDQFTERLSLARVGPTGKTYAFDRQGTLLSRCRFEHQLRTAGLLGPDPLVSSPLSVSLRDPGVDLTSGTTASVPRDQQPLTTMADHATRGGTGEDVAGYNDYRGVPVVGAWQWIPEFGIGVATEMDVAEAYKPMHILNRSFLALIALAAIGGVLFAAVYRIWGGRLPLVDHTVRRLGQYELGEMVGRGGMGAVYRGKHQLLQRDVAIKVLEGEEVSPQSISRFEREVQMTVRLRHPNTIDIYDYGRVNGTTFFYVMEFIDGITLQELVEDFGPQPPSRVIHLLLQICGSLSEAHQLGMIHRDVKPSNILLTARAGLYDMIKVLDFGLVKEVNRDTVELTQSDGITGTPMYMSPEAVRDAATADQRSDLYSVGAVGYTLLTGRPTFEGDSSVDVCLKQLNEEPVRPCERIGRELPEDLQNLLMSCLRKQPEERPMSIDDLESALRQCGDAGNWGAADALRWWEVDFDDCPDRAANETTGAAAGQEDSSTTVH